jgi:hypothetical protein
MTQIRIKLTKVEDMTIRFDENTSELILESKTDKFPVPTALATPAGTSLEGLRAAGKFVLSVASYVDFQCTMLGIKLY